jgi:Kef-type K+ transport system membrane component KefB
VFFFKNNIIFKSQYIILLTNVTILANPGNQTLALVGSVFVVDTCTAVLARFTVAWINRRYDRFFAAIASKLRLAFAVCLAVFFVASTAVLTDFTGAYWRLDITVITSNAWRTDALSVA